MRIQNIYVVSGKTLRLLIWKNTIHGKMISFVYVMDNFVPFYILRPPIQYLSKEVAGGVSAKVHYSLWTLKNTGKSWDWSLNNIKININIIIPPLLCWWPLAQASRQSESEENTEPSPGKYWHHSPSLRQNIPFSTIYIFIVNTFFSFISFPFFVWTLDS